MQSRKMPFFMEFLMTELQRHPDGAIRNLAEMLEVESQQLVNALNGKDAFTLADYRKIIRKLELQGPEKQEFLISIAEHKKNFASLLIVQNMGLLSPL